MRVIASLTLMLVVAVAGHAQATVSLRNLGPSGSSVRASCFEVGDQFLIQIFGAPILAPVSLVFDGTTYSAGSTDAYGNFVTTGTMTSIFVGPHTEYWYVYNNYIQPANGQMPYLPCAQNLPNLNVYSNFTGSNCTGVSAVPSSCMDSVTTDTWLWAPLTYDGYGTDISGPALYAAVTSWNNLNGPLPITGFDGNRLDIDEYPDETLGVGVFAETYIYSEDCNTQCFDHTSECSGQCANSDTVYYAQFALNGTELTNAANAYTTWLGINVTEDELAQATATHELGHTLRLGDILFQDEDGICSEVQDVMYQSLSVSYTCPGGSTPSSCDLNVLNSIYPNGVANCGTGVQFCTGTSCQ